LRAILLPFMPRTKHFNEIIFPEELSVEAKA